MTDHHTDVLIVGAGISGVSAAWHLQKHCPGKRYTILEKRAVMGGTWDLFRYPGIRSDSDMFTLGFRFKPWEASKAIADGPSILSYVNETADEFGIRDHILFNREVVSLDWSSEDALWRVRVVNGETGETEVHTANMVAMCAGYYSYENPYTPDFEGLEVFDGAAFHAQHWPEDLDYAGKKIVVVGSGATAVTLIPELARTAGHVTMLQRSPTYMGSRPAEDTIANSFRAVLPKKLGYDLIRWRNILLQQLFFQISRKRPGKVRDDLLKRVREALPEGYDVERHFTPTYNPWDQRLCLVPDGDLFEAISSGAASVVTDHIARFDRTGIVLESGDRLDADIVVLATGLRLQLMGGAELAVDGEHVDLARTYLYKGMMLSGVPNLTLTFGYTNASWTLKADLTSEYLCRILNHMQETGARIATPVLDAEPEERPFVDFSSGYVRRAVRDLPKQGSRKPWRLNQNYALDMMALRFGKVDDGVLRFSKPARASRAEPELAQAAE